MRLRLQQTCLAQFLSHRYYLIRRTTYTVRCALYYVSGSIIKVVICWRVCGVNYFDFPLVQVVSIHQIRSYSLILYFLLPSISENSFFFIVLYHHYSYIHCYYLLISALSEMRSNQSQLRTDINIVARRVMRILMWMRIAHRQVAN